MISVPENYAQWREILNMLEDGTCDEDVLIAMQKGSICWQTGVAERFAKALMDAVNHRMNAASDRFQKTMSRSHGSDRDLIGALLALRKELQFLVQVVDIPALPEQERTEYVKLVKEQSDKIQQSLEDSAKKDRSGRLLSLVRNHRVSLG